MEQEIWKPVVGYEEYEISTLGRVKALSKIRFMPGNNKPFKIEEKILKQTLNNTNHLYVDLHKNGKRNRFLVHRLIAEAFIPNPDEYPCVRHLNDDPLNNKIDNLSWGTQKMNMRDKCKNNRQQKGTQVKQAKLTENQIFDIRKIHTNKELNQYQIAKKFNVSQSVISEIISRKAWKHVN